MSTPGTAVTAQGLEVTDPSAYQKRLLDLLGEQEPLEVMAATPGRLAAIVAANDARTLRTRPFEGKWTPLEVIGHLLDGEWTYGYRVRTMLCDDEPELIGMDQDRWVAGQRHNERDPSELLAEYRVLRASNLRLLGSLSPSERTRIGRHRERGRESIDLIIRLLAGHDLWHIDQISRYISAAKSSPRQ